jgi:Holliday junction resolvase RusA-like endonuclease
MNKKVYLEIAGSPMGKQRPKFSKFGTHTPEKTVNYETLVKELFMISKQSKLEGYIKATINAVYSIPKSTSKKKTQLMLNGEIRPTKKPDLDNVAKIVLDALNKLAYDDDSQVVELNITKHYGIDPRVYLTLEEM